MTTHLRNRIQHLSPHAIILNPIAGFVGVVTAGAGAQDFGIGMDLDPRIVGRVDLYDTANGWSAGTAMIRINTPEWVATGLTTRPKHPAPCYGDRLIARIDPDLKGVVASMLGSKITVVFNGGSMTRTYPDGEQGLLQLWDHWDPTGKNITVEE